ncbi:hypothetical protein FE257_006740 [Aspergillus nanangensis]|uniref:NAD(P)-binding domain-containing protein n=1 Tax=Aspergillus nanangensis TaxID=2582783 RepID=A0AAD4CP02_ASPNN|nr:hypothetical protein FE257_006740 [Aspergillus nanangensis]
MAKVAFVTGCNGVSGNAIVEYLIRQPKEEWRRIVITSRSPLKSFWQDPRIDFVAIDFLAPLDEIIEKCPESDLNVPLFENFLTATDTVARSSLQRVCLQTGGKNSRLHEEPPTNPTEKRG